MPIYKVVFSNEAIHTLGIQEEQKNFVYLIDAPTSDDAIGLAEIEFAQKHPQKLSTYYRPHIAIDGAEFSGRVQHFDRSAPINPDQ